jgi:hypothetical protein
MKPPTFVEAKEPLATDAWIRALEAKFLVFTKPCSEESKASFAALQLCGAAQLWWENFIQRGIKSHALNLRGPSRNITVLRVSWIER